MEGYKKEVLGAYWEEGLWANLDQLVKREWVVQVLQGVMVVIQGANRDQLVRKEVLEVYWEEGLEANRYQLVKREWVVQVLRVLSVVVQGANLD